MPGIGRTALTGIGPLQPNCSSSFKLEGTLMFLNKSSEQSNNLADQVAQSHVVTSTQQAASAALGSLASTAQDLRGKAEPLFNRASEQASAMAHRGLDSVRDTAQQLRDKAYRASDDTVNYVKDEPLKAFVIAVATGAVLIALFSLFRRSSGRR